MNRSEIDWTFKNTYHPKMCGSCRYYDQENAVREHDHGRLMATCKKLHQMVARTDWCKKPNEQREHKRAMEMYRGQNDGLA